MAKQPIENYQSALEELQQILSQLEREEITVDELTAKVERASQLIEWCESKLKSTEERVRKIIGPEG